MHAQSQVIVRQPADAEPDAGIKLIGLARSYGRDQEIYSQGASADHVYKVVSGVVRSYRLLSDGRRQICDFSLPGDIFGLELGERRQSAADALADAVVIVARWSAVASDPDKLWNLALAELQRSQDHVVTLGRRSAVERVARFLLDLAARLEADGEFDLPVTRQDMADYLGLTIETVSRTMTQLQAQGLIALRGCRRVRLVRQAALTALCE